MKETKTEKNRYYIAYGSNLNATQFGKLCPAATKIGTSMLQNYRLMFRGCNHSCHLNIEPLEGDFVPVGVFLIEPSDETNLDHYEGFPFYYYKKTFRITLDNGEEIEAFAYIMHDEDDFQPGFPSSEYYRTVKEGYMDFGFDLSILKQALLDSTQEQRPFGWMSSIEDGMLMGHPLTAEEALDLHDFFTQFDKEIKRINKGGKFF